jgi:sigma-B regulation protein RsbU (phosphoserine phosphatase)
MIATRGFNSARRIAQFYQPMNNLSGDWMSVFECDNGRSIYALVGDVSGHGIPQGLVTMAAFGSIQTLRPLIQQNSKSFTPAAILNILRSSLVTVLHECQLAMTVSIIKIDLETRKITMSSAGHPLPIVMRPTDKEMKLVTLTAKSQSPLGYEFLTQTTSPVPYRDTTHTIEAEDTLLLFSDGLVEARNTLEKTFQKDFIKSLKKVERRFPPSILLDKILQSFQNFTVGSPSADDICLMIIDTRKDEKYEDVG